MGSITELPESTSPALILTNPTEAEKRHTWTLNHAEWGGALSQADYLAREPYLGTIPLAENGGMQYWILTEAGAAPDARPVLASCESLRKKALVVTGAAGGGEVREETAYGIASVFTEPRFRGRRHASRMLAELGRRLEQGVEHRDGEVVRPIASALWSDIGKSFYNKLGWAPCPSLHVAFRASGPAVDGGDEERLVVEDITYENLEAFCRVDEALLRKNFARHSHETTPKFAFIPNHDIMRWHLYRDDFIAKSVFKDQEPSHLKGAVAGTSGRRVWAVWTREYKGDGKDSAKNTMYILRLVVEDETAPPEELAASFRAVMRKAQAEATEWSLGKIEMWNPTPTVDTLIKKSGLEHELVERDMDSIPSLMWYGEGEAKQVDWVVNEKFCWC